MHIDKVFPTPWIRAGDIDTEWVGVIADFKMEEVGAERKPAPVLRFSNHDKALILNRINTKTIGAIYGKDTDAWIGREITLFATTAMFGNELRDAVRVKPAPAQAPAKAAAKPIPAGSGTDLDDAIPF